VAGGLLDVGGGGGGGGGGKEGGGGKRGWGVTERVRGERE